MKNSFTITYNNKEISIEKGADDDKDIFIAHLPLGDITLESREDDEGACRWIDTRTNNETEESKEIGELIDLYSVKQGAN